MSNAMHRSVIVFWMLCCFLGQFPGLCAGESTDVPKKILPRFHKVNETLYRGGMPKEEGFKFLRDMGVKTIINFRNDSNEQALVQSLGMHYVHIPLTATQGIHDLSIQEFFKAVRNSGNHPVFVHCKRGADRTGTMVAFYRIAFEGWSQERAYREARDIGLHWWYFKLKKQIREFDPKPFADLLPIE